MVINIIRATQKNKISYPVSNIVVGWKILKSDEIPTFVGMTDCPGLPGVAVQAIPLRAVDMRRWDRRFPEQSEALGAEFGEQVKVVVATVGVDPGERPCPIAGR